MKAHLAIIRTAAALAILAAGYEMQEANGQYAPQNGQQQFNYPTYGYQVARNPAYSAYPPVYQQTAPQRPRVAVNAGATAPANPTTMTSMPAPQGNCEGCDTGSPYPTTGACGQGVGCGDSCGYENYSYGYGGYAPVGYGLTNCLDNGCSSHRWFGGAYGLIMKRESTEHLDFVFQIDTGSVAYPYYPPQSAIIISSADLGSDYVGGAEIRFGRTFGDSGCGCGSSYGGRNSCCPSSAWEVAYWGLEDDYQMFMVLDGMPTDTTRMYSHNPYKGLEFDRDGAGGSYAYRPMSDYVGDKPIGSAPGTTDGEIVILAHRARNVFKAQNLELNFLRLPMCGGGCGTSCGGCYAGCGDACNVGGCAPSSCFSMTTLCGLRYMRLDEDFDSSFEFAEYGSGSLDKGSFDGWHYDQNSEIFHEIKVDNDLVGFQLGVNMNYTVCCKWNVFCDTNFGVYNNHMSSYQRIFSGGGGEVRFVNGGDPVSVRSSKDDIAFLGELRMGVAYDMSCNWRLSAAYRAVAMSGIATTLGQHTTELSSADRMALIDSDNSAILHGLQFGVECNY